MELRVCGDDHFAGVDLQPSASVLPQDESCKSANSRDLPFSPAFLPAAPLARRKTPPGIAQPVAVITVCELLARRWFIFEDVGRQSLGDAPGDVGGIPGVHRGL